MLHAPIDVDIETALDADVKSWLAFAALKTDELVVLALALAEGRDEVAAVVYDIHSPGAMLPEIQELPHPFCSRLGAKEAGRGDGRGFAAAGLLRERHGASVWPCDLQDRRLHDQGAKQQRVRLFAAPDRQPTLKCSKQFVRVVAGILGMQS
ncbi:hypothetical protein RFN29_31765 [Mesorhizobium sp. VK22B]|uniref:Uncharacterized protein n=1 Tax=Mesorhizobium captivum TaxID=3072319 RepID=A0ABU4ZA23_9HYPH|nr:hypothetical protein [Mesorhizobium sp. VK22B]MDX8496107.1 hypothetical protein [Mesorhizobium sp. VK22B]